jgi:hypothetical protein
MCEWEASAHASRPALLAHPFTPAFAESVLTETDAVTRRVHLTGTPMPWLIQKSCG